MRMGLGLGVNWDWFLGMVGDEFSICFERGDPCFHDLIALTLMSFVTFGSKFTLSKHMVFAASLAVSHTGHEVVIKFAVSEIAFFV